MIFKLLILLFVAKFSHSTVAISLGRVYVAELFTTKIHSDMFNWTLSHPIPEQFAYRPSLHRYPDLPGWLRYAYSMEHQAGYLYGTPPEHLSGREILLDIVALNKVSYETRKITLSLFLTRKATHTATNSIHMKIDNLNWIHLMDPGRVENLKNIFRQDLWPESKSDLHISFMESFINMGGRKPVQPQQREGIIVHLRSSAEFSDRLKELQEEVKPLYKLTTCIFKRTTVQTIFENSGFKMDWCAFRIVDESVEHQNQKHNLQQQKSVSMRRFEQWEQMSRNDAPERSYIDELAFSIAIPGVIFTILVAILTVILCFHHDKIRDEKSERFFDNIFQICTETFRPNEIIKSATVQMVQYPDATTTQLKSLKDPNKFVDNISECSYSPNNNNHRTEDNSYYNSSTLRPRPPPYKPHTHKNGVDI